MRWITLLGRIGTVILMVGLALILASLIVAPYTGYSGSQESISSGEYRIDDLGIYDPQTGCQISVESADNISVYLLGVSPVELDNWTAQIGEAYPSLGFWLPASLVVPLIFAREAYPNLNDTQIMDIMSNVAVLDKGLQTHPDVILWGPPPSSTFSYEFSPAEVLNIMVIIANRSSDTVDVKTRISNFTVVAPKERVMFPALVLISVGIALAIPWLILRKVKKSTLRQRNNS
jgi:hypothetical protein